MKKLSKVLALLSSASIMMGTVSGFSANASEYCPIEFNSWVPGGYEIVNDAEFYENYSEYFPGTLLYLNSKDSSCAACDSGFMFHSVWMTVKNDDWKEIYDKYVEQIGFNYIDDRSGDVFMTYRLEVETSVRTAKEVAAEFPEQIKLLDYKYDIIKKMCAEMYEKDCIYSFKYRPLFGSQSTNFDIEGFGVYDFGGPQDELDAAVRNATDGRLCIYSQNEPEYDENYENDYAVGNSIEYSECRFVGITFEDYFAALSAVKALGYDFYYDSGFTLNTFETVGSVSIKSPSIDLIAEIEAESGTIYGDLNADGNIGISDAITMNKAVTGVIALNDEQTKAADLNGDGTVNGDDLDILLQYLVDKIDALPMAK